jgi:glycosyltransferase involved in cell wall biosynthesis
VFLEANLFGKAVIGGANGGVPDAVADGVSGLLVTTDRDHRTLAEAMRRLLTEPDFRTRLGQDGRERALTQFDWKSLGQGFVQQLKAIEL